MKPKGKDENRLGPVNPFTVGSVFIEAAKKLEWIEEEKTERQRQFFITSKGFEEMTKLGMDLQRALMYRQPPAPEVQQLQQRQRQQQQQQQPQQQQQHRQQQRQHRGSPYQHHRPKGGRRH